MRALFIANRMVGFERLWGSLNSRIANEAHTQRIRAPLNSTLSERAFNDHLPWC
jgi:hypothetical protein